MSYLDNLESSLKALESQEERDPEKRKQDQEARDAQRESARQLTPQIELLKNGPFTHRLLSAARSVGHSLRIFVDIVWIDTVLRFEARGRRLELRPTLQGIEIVYLVAGQTVSAELLDLSADPEDLIRRWLMAE